LQENFHLASATAACFFSSTKMLERKVIFGAGSLFKAGRELNKNGQSLKKWSGKAKLKVVIDPKPNFFWSPQGIFGLV
jgi:hypothetical protein